MENVTSSSELRLTGGDKANLVTAAKWARFFAIFQIVILAISAAVVLFFVLGVLIAGISIPGVAPAAATAMSVAMLFSLAILLVAFLPMLYLLRFAQKGIAAVEAGDNDEMSASVENLRRYFKFNGIMLIVVIGLWLLLFVVSLIAASSGALWPHYFTMA